MRFETLIEPTKLGGFRLTSFATGIVVESTTREGVIAEFRRLIRDRASKGAEFADIEIPPAERPWMKFAGDLKDDPLFDEWVQAMAENRAELDRQEYGFEWALEDGD